MSNGQSINGVIFNEPWYEVKNVAGTATIFLIDKDGDMYLDADAIAVSSAITGPFANSLIIQDAADEIFVINAANAYFSGKVYPNFATLPTMDGDDMVIQNVAGTPVAIFDGDDNSLYLSGNATHDAVAVEPRNALEFSGATRAAGSYPAGTHEYVTLPSMAVDFSGGMTFEGWFYFDALQNWAHPVRITDGTNSLQIIQYATNADLRFNTVNSTSSEWIESTGIIELNTWIHIAFTVTPTGGGVATGKVYKNGILIETDTGLRSFPSTTWTTGTLGWGSASDGNMSFDGKLDEFRLWTDVRTQSEIQADMFTTYGTLVDNTNLAAYWDFNDVLGSQLIDAHSGNFHGTLQDMNSDAWVSSYTERTLTIVSGGNGTLAPTGAQTVADGQSFPIVATPSAGYTFEYWTKTAGTGTVTFSDSTNDTTWVTVTGGAAEVTAYFDYITWANTTTLTLNTTASYANVATTQTDFPVLIRITSGNFTFADAQGNGEDIRFTTAANVPMDYEIERWDSTNALAEIWVKVPTVTGNSTTDIKMLWGEDAAIDHSDGEAVFETTNSFSGVWHMDDDPTAGAGTVLDATSNALHGTSYGTMISGDVVTGITGQGIDLDGTDDYIKVTGLSIATNYTISGWYKTSVLSGTFATATAVGTGNAYTFNQLTGTGMRFLQRVPAGVSGGTNTYSTTTDLADGDWHYVSFTYDGTTMRNYFDGNDEVQATPGTAIAATVDLYFGMNSTFNNVWYTGIFDEFRVESSARSADWIKLAYENQRSADYLINSRAGNTVTLVDGGAHGSIANEGPNVVSDGNPFALTATPDAGYDVWWVQTAGAGTAVFTDAHAASTSVTVTGGNATITCYFNYTSWSNNTTWALNTTATGANVTTTQTDFPVLIRLNASNFTFAQAQTNGEDVRFAATDESPLDYEIERWDNGGALADIWVKVPTVTGNSTTNIKMYWGNSDAPSLSDGEAVFETTNNFAGVWHLGEDGNTTAGGYADATPNNYDGTGVSMTSGSDESAVLGYGQRFDGTSDYIGLPSSVNFVRNVSEHTLSGWIKFDVTNDQELLGFGINSGGWSSRAELKINNGYFLLGGRDTDGGAFQSTQTDDIYSIGQWYHFVGVTDIANDEHRLYINGTLVKSGTPTFGNTSTDNTASGDASIGIQEDKASEPFDGVLDELRLEHAERSADWIKLTYENQSVENTLLQTTHYETWSSSTTFSLNTTASYANVTTTQTDFPVLIRLTSSNFTFAQARTNGEDIRFADAAGLPLSYEIERWNAGSELAEIWVNVPTITGNSTTDITMYWGRSDVPSESDGAAVFETSNGFSAVWPMSDNGANATITEMSAGESGTLKNSTSNDNTVNQSMEGIIGRSINFGGGTAGVTNGTNSENVTHSVALNKNVGTISHWLRPDQDRMMVTVYEGDGTSAGYNGFTDGADMLEIHSGINSGGWCMTYQDGASTGTNVVAGTPVVGEWAQVVGVWDRSDSLYLYVNGVKVQSTDMAATTYTSKTASVMQIGRTGAGNDTRHWDGLMDQVEIHSVTRSDDWIKLAYENQRSENYLVNQRPQLTITAGANGSVDNAGTSQVVNPMALHATPSAGYTFNGWSRPTNPGNLTITDSAALTTTVTATGSGEVQANFVTKPDNALHFTGATNNAGSYPAGTHEYVELPDIDFQSTGSYTVEAWIYWDNLQNWSRPLYFREGSGSNDGFVIYSDGTGTTLRFSVCDGGGTCTMTPIASYVTLDTWTHVAMSATSSGDITIYKNGAVVGSGTAPNFVGDGVTQFNRFASGAGNANDESFDGYIDDVRIWTDIRSQAEIQNDMFNLYGSYISSDNMLAHWDFNHVMGDTLYESTGTYDGILTDMDHDDWVSSFTTNTLTVTAGANGTVAPTPTVDLATGHSGYVIATPSTGYAFNGWTETTNPGNITLGSVNDFRTAATLIGDGEVTASFTTEPENALSFDGGTSEYVDLPDINEDWSSGFTFEAWVYMDATRATVPVIFAMGNGGSQTLNIGGIANNRNLRIGSQEGGFLDINYNDPFDLDAWTHIAVTIASNGATVVYKNGGQLTTGTLNAVSTINRSDIYIGYNVYGEYFYDGDIDEVRLWNDVRTSGEIYRNHFESYETLHNSGNLVAYWDFNQSLGDVVRDKKGGYHGTRINMEVGDWVTSWTRRTLTINAGTGGTVWPSGAHTAMDNRWYYISATPDATYYFNNWTDDGGAVTASFSAASTAASYALITGGNGAVQANFVQDNTAPSVPTSITTSGFTNGGFNINWGASTDAASGVAGYKVYRNSSTLIGTVTSGTSLWIGRGGYQTYSVLAYDNAGNESAQSRSMYHFEAEARSNSYDITFYDGYYAGDLDDNSGAAPDWIDWNSVVFSGGTYRVSLRKSSNDATYAHSINYQFNNSTYGSISRQEHDGGWTSWKVVYDNNTITAPTGTYKFSALFYGINWNVDWVQMLPE